MLICKHYTSDNSVYQVYMIIHHLLPVELPVEAVAIAEEAAILASTTKFLLNVDTFDRLFK